MDKKALKKLIDDDDLDLLSVKPENVAQSQDDRLISSFKEICDYFVEKGREPGANESDLHEYKLHSRLNALRDDKQKKSLLREHDVHGLLGRNEAIQSLKDVFADDDIGLLSNTDESIFNHKHVPKRQKSPEYVAKRKPCRDFDKFKQLFKGCQEDLRSGKRRILPFAKERQISEGLFFVLGGVLMYVADTIETGQRSPRLRCVFENGTESDMLRHSLGARLYENGKRISEHEDRLLAEFSGVVEGDQETGFVYVLRSQSTRPEIKTIPDLFKVGFSRGPVEDRVRNAHQEPTYLMAPVAIVATYRCFNVNPQKIETLLHAFFGEACLDVDVVDKSGRKCAPREWFVAPFEVIEQAIYFLLTGEIVNFRYDPNHKCIVER